MTQVISSTANQMNRGVWSLATIVIALAFLLNITAPDFGSLSVDFAGDCKANPESVARPSDWDCVANDSSGAPMNRR